MRVAFYAPLKPACDPTPSGDRQMARLFCAAMARAGLQVETASRLRSYDAGDPGRQRRIANLGSLLAARLVRRLRKRPGAERPAVWFTYHLYHKAPDWLGPDVAQALRIPYVLAEASHAPKRDVGPWAESSAAVARAIEAADLVFGLNPADEPCVRRLLPDPRRLVPLAPFIDAAAFEAARAGPGMRAHFRKRYGIVEEEPLLLTVAMMRPGAKLASYLCLAEALRRVYDRRWRLVVAGDGPAMAEVHAALAPLARRVVFLGHCDHPALREAYAACDLYAWPAIGEAYGVAFLEAQAAGLAVVAGRTGGVPAVVAEDETGLLVEEGDAGAFAKALQHLLDDGERRREMGEAARRRVLRHHDLGGAAATIRRHLAELTKG
ncbi:MAG: glycosyltransferase family 4 protein [Rhodospirillales bacterium]|jgi:glycosyltransferase involved in cell wall biosynthesis|nr:glycosyltransferase family 4 protein [Rhodospirillales bacterium]